MLTFSYCYSSLLSSKKSSDVYKAPTLWQTQAISTKNGGPERSSVLPESAQPDSRRDRLQVNTPG